MCTGAMPTKLKRRSARCSVSDEPDGSMSRTSRGLILGAGLLIAALGGAAVSRFVSPSPRSSEPRQGRPIVQIVRQQPGLPDLGELIDRLCPSVAIIVPHDLQVDGTASTAPAVAASAVSADGWLITASGLPQGRLEAVFGDGRRVELSELRNDPVSGLAIAKAEDAVMSPLLLNDQAFPHVGQFGFALSSPAGSGCRAEPSMIGSDFLADGGAPVGYVRVIPPPATAGAGIPLLDTDGRMMGIETANPVGALIPAPIVSVIVDELIRNRLSSSTSFGFRAINFAEPFSSRLGDVRSGAGVALVQQDSPAFRAGLRAGDIVTTVNDVPVSSASELSRVLDATSSKAVLTLQRRSKQLKLSIDRISSAKRL